MPIDKLTAYFKDWLIDIAYDLTMVQDGILKLSCSSDVRSEFRTLFNQSKFPQLEADATASFLPIIIIGDHLENG